MFVSIQGGACLVLKILNLLKKVQGENHSTTHLKKYIIITTTTATTFTYIIWRDRERERDVHAR
jgi:hypothetical protein